MTTLLRENAKDPVATFVFAHGAGAGQDSDFMNQFSELLLARGINLVRFEFNYMAMRQVDGKKRPPARLEKLVEEYQQVIEQIEPDGLPLFIGGKSMGGRVATHVALSPTVKGVICLGYPFHPAGKPDKVRLAHLPEQAAALLILQGDRDALGSQAEITDYELPPRCQVIYLPDGEHSFKPRKASGHTWQGNLAQAADAMRAFVQKKG